MHEKICSSSYWNNRLDSLRVDRIECDLEDQQRVFDEIGMGDFSMEIEKLK